MIPPDILGLIGPPALEVTEQRQQVVSIGVCIWVTIARNHSIYKGTSASLTNVSVVCKMK